MGVVTVSSSAARSPLGFSAEFALNRTTYKRPFILAFKANKHNNRTLVSAQERTSLATEAPKEQRKKIGRPSKPKRRFKANFSSGESPSTLELDYNEAAAKLESIYKLSPTTDTSDVENVDVITKRNGQRRRKNYNTERENTDIVVRSPNKKPKRLDLEKRIALRHKKGENIVASKRKKKDSVQHENEKIENLVREYSSSTDLVSLDWKKIKIPPVLPSSEHAWLFKVMQPMRALLETKENLQKNLGRELSESQLAEATKMSAVQVRKQLEVGHAARNKLIKHNLRLVLFVINKYFQDFANGPKFQDLCQAGVKGLITSIDRFEPTRKFRLSTYSIFWIRHAIIRSMTTSNFTRVSFGLESVRVEIQKAKLELRFELKRTPTEEEIIERVGISPQRYHEVMRASASVLSLHSKHTTTQEEFINAITDVDGVGTDNRRQPALLRLALDDVLDSLKPKESLVVRQRYGLDGKGDRTLGEIAGNLNISREMVRKHEMKAFMKLKHPTRVDYLRRYVV